MQAAADESKYVMDDFYLFGDLDDLDEAEDVEVPKALGDIFESIAGKNVQKLEKRRRTFQKSGGPVVMWWA